MCAKLCYYLDMAHAKISPPIAVADATAFEVPLPEGQDHADIAIVFYSTAAAAEGDAIAAGSGSRDLTVKAQVFGKTAEQGVQQSLDMLFDEASLSAAAARTLHPFSFEASRAKRIRVSAAQNSDPTGATHYRIWVL